MLVVSALIIVGAACGDDDDDSDATPVATASSTQTSEPGIAAVYRETQCLTNPWQVAWLESRPGDQFPTDEATHARIFSDYWHDEGIDVTDVARQRYLDEGEVVCAACNCPTGFEWTATVPADDADKAEAAGFTIER